MKKPSNVISVIVLIVGVGVAGLIYLRTQGNLYTLSLTGQDQDTQLPSQSPQMKQIIDQPQVTSTPYTSTTSSEKAIGYITEVYEEDNRKYLKIDYIEFFMGEAADKAAKEDGFDVAAWGGVPDGIWQRNNNKKIRTFEIDPEVEIIMASSRYLEVGTVIEGKGVVIPYSIFSRIFDGTSDDYEDIQYRRVPYWITLKNNTVVEINQQYLP